VIFGVHNHATEKYYGYRTAVHYWDNIAFDGPSLPIDKYYRVPNSLTPINQYMNMGYIIKTGTSSGVYTCCTSNDGPLSPFVLKNVDLTNATSACLSLSASFMGIDQTSLQTVNLKYRFNGGTWRDRLLTTYEISRLQGGDQGALQLALPVLLSDLKAGDNNLEFSTINPSNNMVVIVNIGLTVSTNTPTDVQHKRLSPVSQNAISWDMELGTGRMFFRVYGLFDEKQSLDIYDIKGKRVCRITNSSASNAGSVEYLWDGRDVAGNICGKGTYLVTIRSGKELLTTKISKVL
jgi:hypothetical protein